MNYSVRRISPADLSVAAKAFLKLALPYFSYSDRVRSKLEAGEMADGKVGFVPRLPRRYSGDIFGILEGHLPEDLPRQRYGALITPNGTDRGVLKSELLAYGITDAMPFTLLDGLNPIGYKERGLEAGQNEIVAEVPGSPFLLQLLSEFGIGSQTEPDLTGVTFYEKGGILVHLPCEIRHLKLDKVMDLRLPGDRETFYKTFYQGVPELMQWPACKPAEFLAMLPHLYWQAMGGTPIHEAIGAFLRMQGYDALIYPSARADADAEIQDGELVDYMGLNLVDYRDSPKPRVPKAPAVVTYCPWARVMPSSLFRITYADRSSSRAGSFSVRGVWQQANANHESKGYYYETDPTSWPSLDLLITNP